MANRSVWRTASSEATYLHGTADDHNDSFSDDLAHHDEALYEATYLHGTAGGHNDSFSGRPADHDDSDFVDDIAGTQERQGQNWHEPTNAIICNGSAPASDAPLAYGGVLYGSSEDTTSPPSPGFTPQAHVGFPNVYDSSTDFRDGAYLLSYSHQLNHQAMSEIPFAVPKTDADDEDVAGAPSPPSTTDTVLNHHGSPGSSAGTSDHSADDSRQDRRLARRAARRSTEQQQVYAKGGDRPSRSGRMLRRWQGHGQGQRRRHGSNGETGQETEGNLAAGFGLSDAAGCWPEVYWTPALAVADAAVVHGPGISLSGYPTHLVEEVEELVDYSTEPGS